VRLVVQELHGEWVVGVYCLKVVGVVNVK
jgi:hypothetical protein